MKNLVYWYGSSDDPANAYSLLATKDLISYENGIKAGLNVIPAAVQKKIEQGRKLSILDGMVVNGLEEMELDLKKDPCDRHGYMATTKTKDIAKERRGIDRKDREGNDTS